MESCQSGAMAMIGVLNTGGIFVASLHVGLNFAAPAAITN